MDSRGGRILAGKRGGWFSVAVVVILAGCGGSTTPSTRQQAPPANQVQQAVVTALNTCISHSFDTTVDLTPVSQATDTLIRFSHTYSLDAPIARSDLKAHTLREALANIRSTLRTCSPADASRVDTVLGNS
jgi:hypothetical protein